VTALETPALDPAAVFQQLYSDFHAPTLARIRRTVGSHEAAEDILQETWRKVFGALPLYLGRPNFNGRGLLVTTADRVAIDHLRRGQSVAAGGRVRFASLELPDGALTPEAAAVGDGLTPEVLVTAGEALHDRRVLTGLLLEALPAGDKALLWWMEYGSR